MCVWGMGLYGSVALYRDVMATSNSNLGSWLLFAGGGGEILVPLPTQGLGSPSNYSITLQPAACMYVY